MILALEEGSKKTTSASKVPPSAAVSRRFPLHQLKNPIHSQNICKGIEEIGKKNQRSQKKISGGRKRKRGKRI
jgi:hypothetical protein